VATSHQPTAAVNTPFLCLLLQTSPLLAPDLFNLSDIITLFAFKSKRDRLLAIQERRKAAKRFTEIGLGIFDATLAELNSMGQELKIKKLRTVMKNTRIISKRSTNSIYKLKSA